MHVDSVVHRTGQEVCFVCASVILFCFVGEVCSGGGRKEGEHDSHQ